MYTIHEKINEAREQRCKIEEMMNQTNNLVDLSEAYYNVNQTIIMLTDPDEYYVKRDKLRIHSKEEVRVVIEEGVTRYNNGENPAYSHDGFDELREQLETLLRECGQHDLSVDIDDLMEVNEDYEVLGYWSTSSLYC